MSCGCNQGGDSGLDPETNKPLPTIATQQSLKQECQPGSTWNENDPCVDSSSAPSTGSKLDTKFTDARPVQPNEGMVLLGRVGNFLARFVGEGFLQIRSGKAYLVSWVPVNVKQLWHRYFKPNGSSVPVLGDPHPFAFGIVGDEHGNLYGIEGLSSQNSVHVWNFAEKQWETKALSDLPIEIARKLGQSNGIELTGFEPISSGAQDASQVRPLVALRGEGLVYLQKVPTVSTDEECGCEDQPFAYVARVLEFPGVEQGGSEEVGRHSLVFSNHGLRWEPEDTGSIEEVLGN